MAEENGWSEYKRLIISALEQQERFNEKILESLRELSDSINEVHTKTKMIELRAAMIGVAVGALVSILVKFLIK